MFTKNTTYEVYFKSVLGDLCPEMEEPDDILKDEELEEFFIGKMVGLIEEAWAARRPGGVALAHEYAAVAFNRRPQFLVNGKRESKMYGDCSEPNFLGYEGPSDHSADMLYTFDEPAAADRRAGLHPVPEPRCMSCTVLSPPTIGARSGRSCARSWAISTCFRSAARQATRTRSTLSASPRITSGELIVWNAPGDRGRPQL